MLPKVVDADVVGAFILGTTVKSLVHKLGCQKPHTTQEVLDITRNHASSKEMVAAIFTSGRARGKAKREHRGKGELRGRMA